MSRQFKADILIVDDTPANLQLLISYLSSHGYRVRAAADGHLGIIAAKASKPDLILLDVMMPSFDGFQVCQKLKGEPTLENVPLIFISAADDLESKIKGFQMGGADYISKPFQFEEVLARIETHIVLYHQRLELERIHAQERLYFQTLSQLKDEFMSTASHDLKNPLNNIKITTDLLSRIKLDNESKRQYYLDAINRQVGIMQQLVNDILELLRLETGRALSYKSVDLGYFLTGIIEDFQLAAEAKQIALHSVLNDGFEQKALLDSYQMRQVLRNLLSNALKYTKAGGRVNVQLHTLPTKFKIEVSDTGLGIAPEDLPHVFDKFFRATAVDQAKIEGTGLGLAIAKTIVEQHGGEIGVESELGVGSTFFVVLPRPLG